MGAAKIGHSRAHFGGWRTTPSISRATADISPFRAARVSPSLISQGAAFLGPPPPLRSPIPLALHSPRFACILLPPPAVCGGGGVVGGPSAARVGSSSSVSPVQGCGSPSPSSSSSGRPAVLVAVFVCLDVGLLVSLLRLPQATASSLPGSASSFPSCRLLPPLRPQSKVKS